MTKEQTRVFEAWAGFIELVVKHSEECSCGKVEIRRIKGYPPHVFVNEVPGGIFGADFVTFDPILLEIRHYECHSWNYPSLTFKSLSTEEGLEILEKLKEKIDSYHRVAVQNP